MSMKLHEGVKAPPEIYQLNHLVRSLEGGTKTWDLHMNRLTLEDANELVLTKHGERVHHTTSPLDMATYLEALVALEGKQ